MRYYISLLLLVSILWITSLFGKQVFPENTFSKENSFVTNFPVETKKLKEALAFCRKQKLDTTVVFFIDRSIHSGKKRFFIVDL